MNDVLQGIITGDFISQLFQVIMGVLLAIVSAILWPISALVATTMPSLDGALSQIASYFDLIETYFGWAVSALALPSVVIALIAGYYAFVITTTLGAWTIKLIVKWKSALI